MGRCGRQEVSQHRGGFASQYEVVAPAKLRAGFDGSSADRGQLSAGEVVNALEGRVVRHQLHITRQQIVQMLFRCFLRCMVRCMRCIVRVRV